MSTTIRLPRHSIKEEQVSEYIKEWRRACFEGCNTLRHARVFYKNHLPACKHDPPCKRPRDWLVGERKTAARAKAPNIVRVAFEQGWNTGFAGRRAFRAPFRRMAKIPKRQIRVWPRHVVLRLFPWEEVWYELSSADLGVIRVALSEPGSIKVLQDSGGATHLYIRDR